MCRPRSSPGRSPPSHAPRPPRRSSATGSSAALELADGVFRAMIVAKLRVAASFLAGGAIILAVGAAWIMAVSGSSARDGEHAPAPVVSRGAARPNRFGSSTGERAGSPVEFRVVDQRTGKHLPGVTLTVNVDRQPRSRITTDEAGRAAIAVPAATSGFLSVVFRKDGFAPVTLWFPSPIREEEIPASFTQAMYSAETIGGVVRDEQGRPVAGVTVAPTIWTNSAEIRYFREDFEKPAAATTDDEGRWQCEGMPAGIDRSRVSIAFTHPDYQHVNLPAGRALEDVRGGKATVLPRGWSWPAGSLTLLGVRSRRQGPAGLGSVRGRRCCCRDGRRRPVPLPPRPSRRDVADSPGRGIRARRWRRPSCGPASRRWTSASRRAGRSRVAWSTRRASRWKGPPWPWTAGAGIATLDWRMTTDEDGEFRWTDAPPDAFWIGRLREKAISGPARREVPPAGGELTIVLGRQLKVRGTVVDAETRHAVNSFTLVPGMESGGGFADLLGSRRGPAGQEGPLRDPVRRHDASGRADESASRRMVTCRRYRAWFATTRMIPWSTSSCTRGVASGVSSRCQMAHRSRGPMSCWSSRRNRRSSRTAGRRRATTTGSSRRAATAASPSRRRSRRTRSSCSTTAASPSRRSAMRTFPRRPN